MAKVNLIIPNQIPLDFNKPVEDLVKWPDNTLFPLNRRDLNIKRTVLQEILKDIKASEDYLVVTGFTSLAHIIDFFGKSLDYADNRQIRIVLGFEPELKHRKYWKSVDLSREIKDLWLDQSYSILNGGEVIRVIEFIKQGKITFKFLNGLHAKIYVGATHAILGSANFSRNGVTLQQEANIRVCSTSKRKGEQEQFENISLIGNNFYNEANPYNDEIIALLEGLLKVVSWEEALARAIAELVERQWLKDIPELYERLNNIRLWPSQRLGLGQALYILQTQGCVLIADPTGSGKTKLISTLQLVLFHWLWETGRRNKSYAITICPPLIVDTWKKEFIDLQFSNSSQVSMGALSYQQGSSYLNHMKEIKVANIMVVDEAHNFLSTNSNRSASVAEHTSDYIILSTATPINKKVKDLLRLIELLGVDNLKDDELQQFIILKKRPKSFKISDGDLSSLRNYIRKFIVRRTKKDINKLIEHAPELYVNRQGNRCKYPIHSCKTYPTGETQNDILIANQINILAKDLKGLIYLQDLSKPDYDYEIEETYFVMRLRAAKSLTVYNIQAKLRSSRPALVEHIEGTEAATRHFRFKTSKDKSGNIVQTIEGHSVKLPKNEFVDYSPEWLTDLFMYQEACRDEIRIYQKISELTKSLTDSREKGKVGKIIDLYKKHKLVLAFDSTVLTLDYLDTILKECKNGIESYVVTGKSSRSSINKVLKNFDLGSDSENILAFCSDTMSEGVNLQQASAMVFLDMPSVLRIAEQRIGRIDRLDSPHKEVQIFWPNDTQEFALKTDLKLIRTSIDTESLIGSNFTIPQEILDKHMDQMVKPKDMIEALKDDLDQDFLWDGIQDAFKSVHDLYDGDEPLIKKKDYEHLKDVGASVKVKLSIGESDRPWLFLAIKGNKNISPRWYFIDCEEKIHLELSDICQQLRQHLSQTTVWGEKWNEKVKIELNKYVHLLKRNEREMLPSKRKRALDVAEYILKNKLKIETDHSRKGLINELLQLFNPQVIDEELSIDYYHFAQQWLDILTPLLYEKKKNLRRGTKDVISLNNLKKDYRQIDLDEETLQTILTNAPLIANIWNRVAACIIGIPNKR